MYAMFVKYDHDEGERWGKPSDQVYLKVVTIVKFTDSFAPC